MGMYDNIPGTTPGIVTALNLAREIQIKKIQKNIPNDPKSSANVKQGILGESVRGEASIVINEANPKEKGSKSDVIDPAKKGADDTGASAIVNQGPSLLDQSSVESEDQKRIKEAEHKIGSATEPDPADAGPAEKALRNAAGPAEKADATGAGAAVTTGATAAAVTTGAAGSHDATLNQPVRNLLTAFIAKRSHGPGHTGGSGHHPVFIQSSEPFTGIDRMMIFTRMLEILNK